MNDEHLESLLRQSAESEPAVREPSSQLTANVLSTVARRQTRRRRALVVTSVAGAYVAGLLTMWFAFPSGTTEQPVPQSQHIASPDDSRLAPEEPLREMPAPDVPAPQFEVETPDVVVAVDTPSPERSVYQLFQELGDASHASGDVTSSVRYYRLALDSATSQELQPSDASDNLLLLSLKQDRIASTQLMTHGESL